EPATAAPAPAGAASARVGTLSRTQPVHKLIPGEPSSLRDELAALHFDAIKIRTFRGALEQVLDPKHGAPTWLERLKRRSSEFSAATSALSSGEMVRVNWPALPPQIVIDEIRDWWNEQRSDWSRKVH